MPPAVFVEAAKDCIRKMLKRDPKHRARAREILNHDWLRENGCATENVIEVGVITRMKQFNQGNKLKKAVTQVRHRAAETLVVAAVDAERSCVAVVVV